MKIVRLYNILDGSLTAYEIPGNKSFKVNSGDFFDAGEYNKQYNELYLALVKRGFLLRIIDTESVEYNYILKIKKEKKLKEDTVLNYEKYLEDESNKNNIIEESTELTEETITETFIEQETSKEEIKEENTKKEPVKTRRGRKKKVQSVQESGE